MIQFDKPESLNGEQLVRELKAVGIIVNSETSPLIDGEQNFWLDIPSKDAAKAKPIVAAHIGIDSEIEKANARQEILNRLGITEDEANALVK